MPKILVVDDDSDIAEVVKQLLMFIDDLGETLEVQVASGPKAVLQAHELMPVRDFTAVLTDWEMPLGGGAAVIKAALANGIPINRIAVMSAGPVTRSAVEDFLIAEKLDAISFFTKPLYLTELRGWVGKLVVLQPVA